MSVIIPERDEDAARIASRRHAAGSTADRDSGDNPPRRDAQHNESVARLVAHEQPPFRSSAAGP